MTDRCNTTDGKSGSDADTGCVRLVDDGAAEDTGQALGVHTVRPRSNDQHRATVREENQRRCDLPDLVADSRYKGVR